MATEISRSPSEPLNTSKVLKAAIFSRLLLLVLTILWRSLLTPYDTSAPLNPTCLHNPSSFPPPLLLSLASAIENGVVWDSVYFVRIAQCGYEYEQFYAFLPLLPVCIFAFSRTVFAPLVPLIGYRAVLALSGYVVCNVAFIFAAIYFYKLSVIILKDPNAALQASVLFCFNPASVFYSSIYSESLYALLSFGGCYYLLSGSNNIAVLWLALSSLARSNGVLNAGYFGFQTMHQAYDAFSLKKRAFLALWILIRGALRCVFIFVPFIAFQAYGYYNMCLWRSSDETRPWCKARMPFLYNYIQSHYWGVGFLRYFQFKQLPNFLLASPILSLAVCSIIYYVNTRPEIVRSLGFQASVEERSAMAIIYSFQKSLGSNDTQFSEKLSCRNHENHNLKLRKKVSRGDHTKGRIVHGSSEKLGYTSAFILPFILHVGFMVATSFFVMHVQVATRFLSASPSLYWFASLVMTSPNTSKKWGYMIWTYCVAYILLGSLLFSNFYPFT
ncbi:Transferase, putative isoform 2 [Hibiscus syriacus]|uniref:GPI mannosyltransferase 2 n=1 Tax=Hibiscus syriacus TaxID=106335 RepID=A0A6A2Y412_HIBSY|nr:GPI mannosyltransferase 2-like [Hibiscus syriacus]KAE8670506.1 Transferase, putative isoform 2 [Hibiscus syriacus]